jgi:trans-aconitate methyltransferase
VDDPSHSQIDRHWRTINGEREPDQVSWYQAEPATSLRLLQKAGTAPHRSVIDVGGGASALADRLLDIGCTDVTVVDLADDALAASQQRLGPRAYAVQWHATDILRWQPQRTFDLWHDRAVFHFLTDHEDRERYRDVLYDSLAPNGTVVIGTFAEDGPTHCSGLPVARYSPQSLAAQFPDLRVEHTERERHRTPGGNIQPFTWLVLSRHA